MIANSTVFRFICTNIHISYWSGPRLKTAGLFTTSKKFALNGCSNVIERRDSAERLDRFCRSTSKQYNARYNLNVEGACQGFVFQDIQFHDIDLALELVLQGVHDWRHQFAWSAPFRGKIYNEWAPSLKSTTEFPRD